MRYLYLLPLLTIFFPIQTYALTNCKHDSRMMFDPTSFEKYGNVKIINKYRNGECSLSLNVTRTLSDGRKVDESYDISDQGKIYVFLSAASTFKKTTRNSRATENRTYYILPRKRSNVAYEVVGDEVHVKMANGETFKVSTKSGEIVDITNTKWKRDKTIRTYIRNGKHVAEDVYSNNCHNCSLKYKVKFDSFKFSKGGLNIESVKDGVVMDTGTYRGGDARVPSLWGKALNTEITDPSGKKCRIENKYLYNYIYENLGGRKSIDKIFPKFKDDFSKVSTRGGKLHENLPEFLARVCGNASYGQKGFDTSFYNSDQNHCDSCTLLPGKESINDVEKFSNQIREINRREKVN